ncbi:hypothetical protein QAD02_001707 [Eretmocerus hayati]|uniref:Uncharacterized protein n=1 Tax=Eretmocerus hayati TaxID=131215 RepID=A0ACC2NGX5_9HYME|nr:hypothetical protein QAD02_001707 [Eretmocerus hayati]
MNVPNKEASVDESVDAIRDAHCDDVDHNLVPNNSECLYDELQLDLYYADQGKDGPDTLQTNSKRLTDLSDAAMDRQLSLDDSYNHFVQSLGGYGDFCHSEIERAMDFGDNPANVIRLKSDVVQHDQVNGNSTESLDIASFDILFEGNDCSKENFPVQQNVNFGPTPPFQNNPTMDHNYKRVSNETETFITLPRMGHSYTREPNEKESCPVSFESGNSKLVPVDKYRLIDLSDRVEDKNNQSDPQLDATLKLE